MSAKWHSCIAAVREPATGFRRDGSRSLRYRNHSCLIVCNSGDSLYSVLAEFKAVMLNAFVEEVEEAPRSSGFVGMATSSSSADYSSFLGFDEGDAAVPLFRERFAGNEIM